MSITCRNCSGVSRVAGTAVPTPGVVDQHVDRARARSTASATTPRAVLGLATSAVTATQRRPSASTCSAVSLRRSVRRAPIATSAPASASADGERGAEAGGGAGDDGDLAVEPEAVED